MALFYKIIDAVRVSVSGVFFRGLFPDSAVALFVSVRLFLQRNFSKERFLAACGLPKSSFSVRHRTKEHLDLHDSSAGMYVFMYAVILEDQLCHTSSVAGMTV